MPIWLTYLWSIFPFPSSCLTFSNDEGSSVRSETRFISALCFLDVFIWWATQPPTNQKCPFSSCLFLSYFHFFNPTVFLFKKKEKTLLGFKERLCFKYMKTHVHPCTLTYITIYIYIDKKLNAQSHTFSFPTKLLVGN